MNIIICENKKSIKLLLPYVNLDKFIIVSSQLSAKVLTVNNSVNYLLYTKDTNIDNGYFSQHTKDILSFDEFISIINTNKKKGKEKDRVINDNTKIVEDNISIKNNIVKQNSNTNKPIFHPIPVANKNVINSYDENKQNQSYENINVAKQIEGKIIKGATEKHAVNNIYVFTSVKGGVGVSSLIVELAQNKYKKLILDLGFEDGGSDISYYFKLPQVPHIGTYIADAPESLKEHTIAITKDTEVLQAPAANKIYDKISINDILRILKNYEGIILIDMPAHSKYREELLSLAKKIFIVTNATPMEVNRIQMSFNNYVNKTECLILNSKNKNYKNYFSEYNLQYLNLTNPIKQLEFN